MKNASVFALRLLVVLGLGFFLAPSTSSAIVPEKPLEMPEAKEGYAGVCSMFLAGGSPVVNLYLYETAEIAKTSRTSIQKPKEVVVIDAGPGYQIAKLHKNSRVRLICNSLDKLAEPELAKVIVNKEGVLTSITIGDQTVVSDAFVLKSTAEKEMLTDLVRAYIAKDTEIYQMRMKALELANPSN